MIKKRVNKINWHGSDLENNRAKAPNISTPGGNGLDGLNDGEIYVCNADEDPAIFIKTNKDKVARVGGNGSDSYSRDQIDDFLGKKLDKVVWDRNLEERVDDNGDEYLFLTKPLITAYGVTMYAGADVQVPSIYEGLPIDGVTIQWVDGKLVATGGKGTANGIVVNGNTYTPNDDGIITLPNYPTSLEWGNISGKPSWIGSTKPSYSWDEIGGKPEWIEDTKPTYDFSEIQNKPTTIAGYGITDAYTKNDISGLLADYVTKSGAQDITGVKSFINGLNIGDILVKKHSDGVVELDGDLILTGSLTMFAQGSHTASTILDALPIDNTTLSKEGGVLSVIGGVGGGSVDGIILNGTTYSPDETTKLITLPNYPTTLPASDVYSWAKQPNKPSYSFDELSSHPTTLGGYGITDAYTKTDADSRYFRHIGDTYEDGRNTGWIGFGTGTYIEAYPDGIAHKIYSFGQVTSFNSSYSRLELYSTHTSSDPNDGNNGIQFRSGWNDDKKSWRMLLDEVNYLHYTDNRYVNKAGDTMTGNLVFAHTSERPSYSGSIGITFREQIANGQGVKLVYNDYDNYRAPAGLILVGEQGGEYFEAPAIYQNGYKVWDAGNDGSGSGLDADLLDGKHLHQGQWDSICYIGGDGVLEIGKYIDFHEEQGMSSDFSCRIMTQGDYQNTLHLPTSSGTLATLGDNVASATKLQTPRYIYGNLFDGTSDIPVTAIGQMSFLYFNKANGNSLGYVGRGSSNTNNLEFINYEGSLILGTYNGTDITITTGHNVGIGTTSPSYKLHVNGDILANGWLRTYGDVGWVSETYGGGIYMTDTTWVKVYNDRHFQCKGTIYGYRYSTDNNAAAFAFDKPGSYNAGIGSGGSADLVRLGPCDPTGGWHDWGGQTWQLYGNFLTTGGITMYSDLRKKNVLNSIIVPLDVMANADLFDYTFKTDEKCKVRAGTSAQYWNVFLPQVTDTDNEGFFTMSYDVLATTCVLSIAKHFQRFLIEDFNNHETRIEFLERENKELKNSNKEMMNHIIELERRVA